MLVGLDVDLFFILQILMISCYLGYLVLGVLSLVKFDLPYKY